MEKTEFRKRGDALGWWDGCPWERNDEEIGKKRERSRKETGKKEGKYNSLWV